MKKQSNFPQRICFYCRPKDENGVYHAFPIDAESKNKSTAISWAKHRDFLARPNSVEFENSGFDNVTIESLQIRDEGGRAYQVILEHQQEKYKFDLREGTLMDVIRHTGIAPGGKLGGTFCFIQFGSQMRIIREHSEDWEKALEFRSVRDTAAIGKNDLKIGHLYEKQNGNKAIYAGKAFMRPLELNKTEYRIGRAVPRLLFLEVNYGEKEVSSFLNGEPKSAYAYWQIKTQTNHNLKIDHGLFAAAAGLDTAAIVEKVKNTAEDSYRRIMTEMNGRSYESASRCYELKYLSVDKNIGENKAEAELIYKWYRDYQRGYR